MAKNTGGKNGRPKLYDPEELAVRVMKYCNETDNPIVKRFCIQEGNPCHDTLIVLAKECDSLAKAVKRCIAKQEVWYEEQVSKGNIPPAWAIFKMKQPQHGWTDKQEIVGRDGGALQVEHSGAVEIYAPKMMLPDNKRG